MSNVSFERAARNTNQKIRPLTNTGLGLNDQSHGIFIQNLAHELLRDLAGAKAVEPVSHVNRGAMADLEYLAEELFQPQVNDGSIDGQNSRGNLGGYGLASADKAVAEGRSYAEPPLSLFIKSTILDRNLLPTVQTSEDAYSL